MECALLLPIMSMTFTAIGRDGFCKSWSYLFRHQIEYASAIFGQLNYFVYAGALYVSPDLRSFHMIRAFLLATATAALFFPRDLAFSVTH